MRRINTVVSEFSGLLISAMAVLLILEAITRGIGRPVLGVTEIVTFSLVAVVFLGFSRCEEERAHIRADVFISKLPPRLWHMANLFGYFVALFLFVAVTSQTAIDALLSWQTQETVIGIALLPVYPAKFAVVIGCALYLVQLLLNTIEEFREPRTKLYSMKE